eukprot:573957_1
MRPVTSDRCEVSIICNLDFNMSYVPQSFINFVTRKLSWYGFKNFAHACTNLEGSIHEERMKENSEFYDGIRRNLDILSRSRNQSLYNSK